MGSGVGAGTGAEWNQISIADYNLEITDYATLYYYSETAPAYSGNFWRYVDGIPTPW